MQQPLQCKHDTLMTRSCKLDEDERRLGADGGSLDLAGGAHRSDNQKRQFSGRGVDLPDGPAMVETPSQTECATE